MGATGHLGRRIIHALIEQDVSPPTNHVEQLTGTPPTAAKTYLPQTLNLEP